MPHEIRLPLRWPSQEMALDYAFDTLEETSLVCPPGWLGTSRAIVHWLPFAPGQAQVMGMTPKGSRLVLRPSQWGRYTVKIVGMGIDEDEWDGFVVGQRRLTVRVSFVQPFEARDVVLEQGKEAKAGVDPVSGRVVLYARVDEVPGRTWLDGNLHPVGDFEPIAGLAEGEGEVDLIGHPDTFYLEEVGPSGEGRWVVLTLGESDTTLCNPKCVECKPKKVESMLLTASTQGQGYKLVLDPDGVWRFRGTLKFPQGAQRKVFDSAHIFDQCKLGTNTLWYDRENDQMVLLYVADRYEDIYLAVTGSPPDGGLPPPSLGNNVRRVTAKIGPTGRLSDFRRTGWVVPSPADGWRVSPDQDVFGDFDTREKRVDPSAFPGVRVHGSEEVRRVAVMTRGGSDIETWSSTPAGEDFALEGTVLSRDDVRATMQARGKLGLRVSTSYRIPSGAFTGTSYDLQLAGDLSADYFAMVLGTVDTTGVDADNVGVRITADPFSTGDLSDSGAPDILTLTRGASDEGDWEGVIVVWESLGDAGHSGFSLVDVKSIPLSYLGSSGVEQSTGATANTAWSDLDQVVLYGGLRGGGVSATSASDSEFDTLAVKLVPSGTDSLTASRWSVAGLQAADITVYVVQWGDEHTIQRVIITGSNGGDGIDADTEYETASISEVERSRTWLWMSGWTKSTGEGAGLLGLVPALGDGTESSSETASSMGIGCEVSVDKSVCLVAHTHPDLQVDWQFFEDDDSDTSDTSRSYDARYASRPETWDEASTPKVTDGYRAALVFHSSEATTTNHERVLWTARHTAAEDLDAERTSSGTEYAGWVQSVDLGAVEHLADEDEAIIATTYELSSGQFTGTTYDLVLEHALAENYFVMLYGKVDVSGPDVDNVGVRITADPFGTGDLSESGSDDVLTLSRLASDEGDWEGTIVVVECVADPDGAGFRLRDVNAMSLDSYTTTGSKQTTTATANAKWKDLDQVALYGGLRGGGITPSSAASQSYYDTVAVRLEPSGDDSLTAERWAVSVLMAATMSVYVVEWGSEHTIQRVDVSGTAGGDGVNATSEYDTATITSVTRANTWVWGCGWAKDQGVGDGALTAAVTLGDGVNQNATESTVAVGSEYTDERSFLVTVHSHPSLAVDYVFKPDGDLSASSYDYTVDAAAGTEAYETRTNPARTSGARFPVVTPTSNGTGTGMNVHLG